MTRRLNVFDTDHEPEWLKSKFSQAIFKALGNDAVRFVGGAVRDSIIGRRVSDIDMATTHKPEAMAIKLKAAGIKLIPTGIKHGTITAVHAGETREITTLRVDVESDGRHAIVAFTDDWKEDAARRDFTINALYLDQSGALYDPFSGLEDLKSRRVRFIGEPYERIKEDALRILRFYRFSSVYAQEIDKEGQLACSKNKALIEGLSAERIRDEMLKLLSTDNSLLALNAMATAGVLDYVFPDGHDVALPSKQIAFDHNSEAKTSALTRMWLLANKCEPAALVRRFRLSGGQRKALQQLASATNQPIAAQPADIRKMLYLYGPVIMQEVAQLRCELGFAAAVQQQVDTWHIPSFPITAKDLMARGFKAGPQLGMYLKELEMVWMNSDFSLTKNNLLNTVSIIAD